jgi:hypothetical protein
MKHYLWVLMAALLMTACSSEGDSENGAQNGILNDNETIGKAKNELTFRLSLRNELGQETTMFKEGENIFFRLIAQYRSTDSNAYEVLTPDVLFGITAPYSKQDDINTAIMNTDHGPSFFAVYRENGQCMGTPMQAVIYSEKSIQSGDSLVFECPWQKSKESKEEVFSDIFKLRGNRLQLAPGRYYTCVVTQDKNQDSISYTQHKVYFNVEATPWTEYTKEGAKRLVGRWKVVYKGGKDGDYDEYLQFDENGSASNGTYSMFNDWTYQDDSQQLSGHIFYSVPSYVCKKCFISNDNQYLTIVPGDDDGMVYIVDPATKYIRVE